MPRRTRRNIGIVGLGIIGSRVADNLRRKGLPVFVWNRTPRPVPNFVGSPLELAELCDLIQIFVSDDDALLEMVQRMKSSLNKQHVIIASTTVSPDTVRAAAEIIERRGGRLVDAPFTGSKDAAAKGELVYYVGGDPAAIEEVRPALEASGKQLITVGGIGHASAMKIATNIVTAASVQAAAEALALVHDAGIAPDKFAEAMQHNGSNSKTLDMKLPKMISGDLDTQFSVKHMLKDMAIASRIARSLGIEFGVADAARLALQAQQRDGRADADYSAVIRSFFPSDGPLKPEQSAPDTVEDQPTLTGLEARPSSDHSEVLQRIFAIPHAAPAAETSTTGLPAESTPRPDRSSVAAPEAGGHQLPHSIQPLAGNGEEAKHGAVAVAAPPATEPSGGLFRRFVRRSGDL